MEFNPQNPIVKLCLQGMDMEENGRHEEAEQHFLQAWNEATNDFEKFLTAYYVARMQKDVTEQVRWTETALAFALKVNNESVTAALPGLYLNLAKGYEALDNPAQAKENYDSAASYNDNVPADKGPFYHGTRADLKVGDLLIAGGRSNYKEDLIMNHIYFTAIANGAGLAAALAGGAGRERIYIVEPTGSFEDDPNVTNKKFPGNPTRSYRSTAPLKIVGEVSAWERQSQEAIRQWKEKLAKNDGEIIN